jgi:hypothetical protein
MPDDVERNVDTEGGAAIDGSVNAGGDFVGRDQHTHVSAEDYSVAVGRDVHGDIYVYHSAPPSPATDSFESTPNLEESLDDYREDVRRRFGTIQIFGQPEPVSLEGIFTHVRLLDEPTAFQRYDIRALQAAMVEDPNALRRALHTKTQKDLRIIEGAQLVGCWETHRLLVLGKPGAGKTTLLQHLALEAAKGTLQKLPIFVALREWREIGDHESLLTFLARQFDSCQFRNARSLVNDLLRHSDTLVLFDGLDEIREEDDRRGQAIDALRDFARKYPRAQIIITCRVAATDYTFHGFRYVELADFDDEQMYTFVQKWFREKDLAQRFWTEYQQDENEGLRELGRIPLLLALLCLGYEATQSFPHRRVDLYEEALDALLKKWDTSRRIRRDEIYQNLSLRLKHQMFAQLAAEYFQDGRYFFRQRELADRIAAYLHSFPSAIPEEEIGGETVLQAIEAQHGILVERARHIHTFAHLTFQEYYTAKYVVDHADMGTVPRLMPHIAEYRWRETILLVASMLQDTDLFFVHFLKALEDLLQSDDKLLELLTWAERKVHALGAPSNSATLRAHYLARTFTYTSVHALGTENDPSVPPGRARARDFARDIVRTLDPALSPALDYGLALDRDLALRCALDSALDNAHAQALASVHSLDREHIIFRVFTRDHGSNRILDRVRDRGPDYALHQAHNHARELGLETLRQAIETLKIPTVHDEPEDWDTFATALQALMIEYRDIGHDWDFTQEQMQIMDRYLYATHLLVECLDVATVTDREIIEDRLLRPPQQKSMPDDVDNTKPAQMS